MPKFKKDSQTGRLHRDIQCIPARRSREPLLDRMQYHRAALNLMGYLTKAESQRIWTRIREQWGDQQDGKI